MSSFQQTDLSPVARKEPVYSPSPSLSPSLPAQGKNAKTETETLAKTAETAETAETAVTTANDNGPSQLQHMTAYLDGIPIGPASQGRVGKVRLLKKSLLVQQRCFRELFSLLCAVLREVCVDHTTESAGYGSGAVRVATHTVTERGLRAIDAFLAHATDTHTRTALEEMLFWRSASTDALCDIFDLDGCPSFSFVSHRWAPEGRALGLHCELLFLLAFAPQEYLWLDCCCSPQDNNSFESGNCLKVIWNIASLLDSATDIVTYYATDGVRVTERTEHGWSEEESYTVQSLSHGLARLFQCAAQPNSEQFLADLAALDAQGSARLWCVLEKRMGHDKIAKALESPLYTHPSAPPVLVRSEEEEERDWLRKDMRNNADIARQDDDALHEANKLSLDCFCAADIEPVTAVMFQRRMVPVMFRDNWPVVPREEDSDNSTNNGNDNDNNEFIHAIRLPRIVAKPKKEKKESKREKDTQEEETGENNGEEEEEYVRSEDDPDAHKACEILELNGWYYNDVLAKHVFSVESFHVNILWPQNPSIPRIHLQVHAPCLLRYDQPLWRYDVDKAKKGFFNRVFDWPGRNRVFHSKCIFCVLDDAEEMFCDKGEGDGQDQQEDDKQQGEADAMGDEAEKEEGEEAKRTNLL